MIVLIPISMEFTSVQLAEAFRDHVWSKHGLPRKVISDRGPQFVSQFMQDLYKLVGVTPNPSTAYHPQTDGQTERINQEVEQYLRIFINYHQDDWNTWLPCAEFAYNNRVQTSINVSPFFINYGQHPYSTNTRKSQSAMEFTDQMKKIWEETEASLVSTANQMKH